MTYSGLPGNATDWIAIAPVGSVYTTFVAWVYSNGQTSGTATFTAPAAGSYVARTFANNSATLLAESPVFRVSTATVSHESTDLRGRVHRHGDVRGLARQRHD